MPTHRPCLGIGRRQGSGRSHPRNKSSCRCPAWLHIGSWQCIARCTSLLHSPSHQLHSRSLFGSQQQGKYLAATHTLPCRPVAGSVPCRNHPTHFHLRRLRPSEREFHLWQVPSHRRKRFHRCPIACLHYPACQRASRLWQVPSHRRKRFHRCPMACLHCPAYHREMLHQRRNSRHLSCCCSSRRMRKASLPVECGGQYLCFA